MWWERRSHWRYRSAAARPASHHTTFLLTSPLVPATMGLVNVELVKDAASEVATRYRGVQWAIEVRNRLILEAFKDGVPQAELADAAGLSQQRISQLVYDSTPEENGR